MNVWDIVQNSLKQKLRDRKGIFFQIVFPFILTALFIVVFSSVDNMQMKEAPKLRVAVVGDSEDIFTQDYKAYMEATTKIKIVLFPQLREARRLFERGDLDVLIRNEKGQRMTYELRDSEQNLGAFVLLSERYMQQKALISWHYKREGQKSASITPIDFMQLQSYKATKFYRLLTLKGEGGKENFALSIGVTMIAFTILLAASYGAEQVAYMREALGQRLLTTPLSKKNLYLGEYLGGAIMAFWQGCCIVLAIEICFGLGLTKNIGQLLGILLSTSFMSIAMGIAIGMLIPNKGLSNGVVSMLVLIFCFTSGGMVPTSEVSQLASLSPVTLMNEAFIAICQKGVVAHFNRFLLKIGGITVGVFFVAWSILGLQTLKRRYRGVSKKQVILGGAFLVGITVIGGGLLVKQPITLARTLIKANQETSQHLLIFENQLAPTTLYKEQILKELSTLSEVSSVGELLNTHEITVKTWKDKETTLFLTGMQYPLEAESYLPLEAGRFFSKEEERQGASVLVVLDTYAKIMWGEEEPLSVLNKQVVLEIGGEKRPFHIIGILDTGTDMEKELGPDVKLGAYMSLKTYRAVFGEVRGGNGYTVHLKEGVSIEEGYRVINACLRHYGKKEDYTIMPYLGKLVR
ncbi:hypothetical protein CS063_10580 [Sporanaerobium hydrogeniformans]|uniref:Uncharacterized protein n=1 Tax=Sporanaerobium hydrogeniformans TaxID=3072179 RepID=A0AC61DAF4_9FIRM|nr:ABC transporter permease [Sporanaerobium hydrogeniformans]PHV70329.1 hypothetical protein CS063_10580 [Sporanaerobium hydrogeniformans]